MMLEVFSNFSGSVIKSLGNKSCSAFLAGFVLSRIHPARSPRAPHNFRELSVKMGHFSVV